MKYGTKPKELSTLDIISNEMLFYQYLPIKLTGEHKTLFEERLKCFEKLIDICCNDFKHDYGLERFNDSYIYLTVKKLYQTKGYSFNRKGYHCDGFLTDDVNYIWSDSLPTVFNFGEFDLTLDDNISIAEMESQAKKENEFTYPVKTLLRLDQFVIHKVSEEDIEGIRTFAKISFSKDKYDLLGNSKNYLLDYDWIMRDRSINRNIPQNINK